MLEVLFYQFTHVKSRLHRGRNRFCRISLKQVMDALYTRFPDALLFVDELQPPSEFAEIPVNSTPPQANETGQSQPNRTLWKTAESYVG